MGDTVSASTQYGDFKGTLSIDGFHGPFLQQLADRVTGLRGYYPVGFEVGAGAPRKAGLQHTWRVELLAVDADAIGNTVEAVQRYAAENGKLPVFRFGVEITFEELVALMKRFRGVAMHKAYKGVPVEAHLDG